MKKYDLNLLESMILDNNIILREQSLPFTDTTQSNKFRLWFRKTYPSKANELDLDPTGPMNNPTIQQAWNFKPYDLDTTTAGQEFSKLGSSSGGLDSGILGLGISGWDLLFITATAVGVVSGVAVAGVSIWKKLQTLNKVRKTLPQYLKTKGSGERLLKFLRGENGRDLDKLKQDIESSIKLSKKEKRAAKELLDNPGTVTAVKKVISKEYAQKLRRGEITAEQFIRETGVNPKGQAAREARKIEALQKKYGKMWKQAYEKQKQKEKNIKSDVPKRQWSAVPFAPEIKFSADGGWYLFKSSNVAAEKIDNAIKKSIITSTSNLSIKEQSMLRNAIKSNLTSKLHTGDARMSKKYLGLQQYPSFKQFEADLRAAGVTDKIDMKRYITAQSLWRLAKGL
jgi:uncharacterized membrane protein